jgi:hypothetical protein
MRCIYERKDPSRSYSSADGSATKQSNFYCKYLKIDLKERLVIDIHTHRYYSRNTLYYTIPLTRISAMSSQSNNADETPVNAVVSSSLKNKGEEG